MIACFKDPNCQALNFDQNVCTTTTATTFFTYMKKKAVLDVWVNPTATSVTTKISKARVKPFYRSKCLNNFDLPQRYGLELRRVSQK
jgi:hypothetical protein